MKGKIILMAGVAAIALGSTSGGAFAAASPSSGDASYQELADRVARLEEALQSQQDRSQGDHTRLSTLEQNFNDTSWTFDNARPTVKSGDGRFTMAFRVRFQVDNANFFQDDPLALTNTAQFKDLANGSVVRRAFFGVEGKAFNDFWYEFRLNGGGSNTEGLGNATSTTCTTPAPGTTTCLTGLNTGDPLVSLARVAYLGIPNFRINVGIIEPAFTGENTTSSGQLMFMERPEIDNIAADIFGGSDARRGVEVAFQKQDALLPGDNIVLTSAFTGSKTGTAAGHGNGGDEQSQWLVHGSYRFWSDGNSNAVFGGDYARVLNSGTAANGGSESINLQDRPQIRVDGTRLISTGGIVAQNAELWSANAAANFDNFYVAGEYTHFQVDREAAAGGPVVDHPDFSGWYVEGSWVLTGEPKTYSANATNNEIGGFGAPRVANPFSFSGNSWGAWELTARYSDTNLNWNETALVGGIRGGEERITTLGVNWYLNQNVKVQINDMIVDVDKLSAPVAGVQIGQDMNILGVRLQFSN